VFRPDGEKLRQAIVAAWNDAEVLELDFEDRRVSSVSFLDEAVAVLFLEFPPEVVKRRLRPINLTTTDRATLNRQIATRMRQRGERTAEADHARRTRHA